MGERQRGHSNTICGHRLLYQIQNMFGKRVQDFDAPEGEWMQWVPQLEQSLTLGAIGPVPTDLTNLDGREEMHLANAEAVAPRELRALAMEPISAFLQVQGLDKAIGIQKWAKDSAAALAEAAAEQFDLAG